MVTKKRRQYVILDRNGDAVAEPFDSERAAYDAMQIYRDHCDDIELPMRVARAQGDEKIAASRGDC